MTDARKNTARAALRILYAIDVSALRPHEVLRNLRPALSEGADEAHWEEIVAGVKGVMEKQESIDEEIRVLSPKWRIERMAAVDRNILRLGIFEILEKKSPPLFTINTCVELAKEFGAASTPGFINGLLDQLCQNHDISISG